MKICISNIDGSVYWLKGDEDNRVLIQTPMPEDGIVDLEENSCEVDFAQVGRDEREYLENIQAKLSELEE